MGRATPPPVIVTRRGLPKSLRKAWRESVLGRGTCDALATFWTQAAAAAPPAAGPTLASRQSGFSSSTECGKVGRGRRPSRRTFLVGSLESRHAPLPRSSMDDDEESPQKTELIRGFLASPAPSRRVCSLLPPAEIWRPSLTSRPRFDCLYNQWADPLPASPPLPEKDENGGTCPGCCAIT